MSREAGVSLVLLLLLIVAAVLFGALFWAAVFAGSAWVVVLIDTQAR